MGREATKSVIFPPCMGIFVTAPTYYTTLAAGQEMALMYLSSFGLNKTLALKNAAEIDTEPAFIFHGKSTAIVVVNTNVTKIFTYRS